MKNLIAGLMLSFMLSSAFAQYEPYLSKNDSDHKIFNKYFYQFFEDNKNDSIKIFQEIQRFESFAKIQADKQLLYTLQMVRLAYLRDRETKYGNSYLNYLIKTRNFFSERDEKVYLSSVERRMGDYYFDEVKNYDLAFKHFDRMFNLHRQVTLKEHPYKIGEMQLLVFRSYDFEDFQKCIFYAKATIREEEKEQRSEYIVSNLLFIAYSHRELGSLDSADYYMNSAKDFAILQNKNAEIGIADCNIGLHQFLRNHFEQAEVEISKGIAQLEATNEFIPSQIYFNALLSHIYIQNGKLADSERAIGKVLSLDPQFAYVKDKPKVFDYLAKYYKVKQQPYLALAYIDSLETWNKIIDEKFNTNKFLNAKQHWELKKLKGEESQKLLRRNQMIMMLVLFLFFLIVLYYVQSRIKNKKLKASELALAQATLTLKGITNEIQSKSQRITILESQIQNKNDEEVLYALQKATILTDDDWVNFKILFEKVHTGFITKLKTQFKNLTPAEIRYLVLLKLNFDNKEMAYTLGISTESVRGILFRLRKKTGLTEDNCLLEIIRAF